MTPRTFPAIKVSEEGTGTTFSSTRGDPGRTPLGGGAGETREKVGGVEEGTNLSVSGEAILEAEGEEFSLATPEDEGLHGFGSRSNEKRKG